MVNKIDTIEANDSNIDDLIYGKKIEVSADESIRIEKVHMEGRVLYLYANDGVKLGSITLNQPGNKFRNNEFEKRNDLTYTYILPNGYEVLIPVPEAGDPPFFFTVGSSGFPGFYVDEAGNQSSGVADKQCRLRIENDGSLKVRDLNSAAGTSLELVTILDPLEESDVNTKVDKQLVIKKDWQTVSVREDQAMYIHQGDVTEPVAVLYKLPNMQNAYLLRDYQTDESYTVEPTSLGVNFISFPASKGKKIQCRVKDNEFQIRTDETYLGDKLSSKRNDFVDVGKDGYFSGKINGGRPVRGFTVRQLGGNGTKKYAQVNEDSYGVNYMRGRLVVADGIGSGVNSQHTSAMAVRWIANSEYVLHDAIYHAHLACKVQNTFVEKIPGKHCADAVFVAAEFHGDTVYLAHTGDARWVLVRKKIGNDGKIRLKVIKSRLHTELERMIEDNDLTEREAHTESKYAQLKAMVSTSLYGARRNADVFGGIEFDQVEYKKFQLKKGDYFYFLSDGGDTLMDENFILATEMDDPDQALRYLESIIEINNNNGCYMRHFDDGKGAAPVTSAFDNTTVLVYHHE